MFLVQESLTEDNDILKDSESVNISPLLQNRYTTERFDSDNESNESNESEQFDIFNLVVDNDDIQEKTTPVNALDNSVPSSDIKSSPNSDQLQKVFLPAVPAVDASAPATIQTSDLQLASSQQSNIITLLSAFAQIATAASLLDTLTAPSSILPNSQHVTAINQNTVIDQFPQANEVSLTILFIT
jgi:hypothetical protein